MADTTIGDGRAIRETDKAVLVRLEDEEEVWVPKSVISDDSEVWTVHPHGMEGAVIVQEWWAKANGYA